MPPSPGSGAPAVREVSGPGCGSTRRDDRVCAHDYIRPVLAHFRFTEGFHINHLIWSTQ